MHCFLCDSTAVTAAVVADAHADADVTLTIITVSVSVNPLVPELF